MTDSFEARGDFVPENSDSVSDITSDVETSLVPDFCDAPAGGSLAAVAPVPNGFVKLGLAPELLQAVADLGFTQPTAVQLATNALAGIKKRASGRARLLDANIRDRFPVCIGWTYTINAPPIELVWMNNCRLGINRYFFNIAKRMVDHHGIG